MAASPSPGTLSSTVKYNFMPFAPPLPNTIPHYVTLSRQGLLEIRSPATKPYISTQLSLDASYAPRLPIFLPVWNHRHLLFLSPELFEVSAGSAET